MTENVFGEAPAEGVDPLSPEHVAALVAYLASPAADSVNGQVFVVYGPMVALMAAPVVERRFDAVDGRWTPGALAAELGNYFGGSGSCHHVLGLRGATRTGLIRVSGAEEPTRRLIPCRFRR